MKVTDNIILITGGGSGIGFGCAELFSSKKNKIILVGRNKAKIEAAASKLNNASAIACDITNEEEVNQLVQKLNRDFGDLNVLMNNAGVSNGYILSDKANAYDKAKDEILTNYLAVIRLTEKLLPLLSNKNEAAIINVSSRLAIVPSSSTPTYSASKAALHSYTQSLRFTLQKSSSIKVFELMPPATDTEFAGAIKSNKITPAQVASELLNGLENDQYEIHVAGTADLYKLFLTSPTDAFDSINEHDNSN